jgi:hypothetical protein
MHLSKYAVWCRVGTTCPESHPVNMAAQQGDGDELLDVKSAYYIAN